MRAVLQAVQPYELHGVLYYQIQFAGPDGRPQQARISHDMGYRDPRPGDEIEVHSILGIVDRVTRVDAAPGS